MKIALVIILSLSSLFANAQSNEQRKANFNTNEQNVVNDGYDPVSYFNESPLMGREEFAYSYKGVIYWFANSGNKSTFINNPQKFEPQYGGWCAYALGLEPQKVKVDPETYKIVDGKLYLFYNFGFTNTLKSWNKQEDTLLHKADKNWAFIVK